MIYIGNIEILTAKSAIYLGNVGLISRKDEIVRDDLLVNRLRTKA